MPLNLNSRNVHVERVGPDNQGDAIHIEHIREPVTAEPPTPLRNAKALADQYVRDVARAEAYDLGQLTLDLGTLAQSRSDALDEFTSSLRFAGLKSLRGTTVVSYVQTLFGVQVWQAGLSVYIQDLMPGGSLLVTSSDSAVHRGLNQEVQSGALKKPEINDDSMPNKVDIPKLEQVLNLNNNPGTSLKNITNKRLIIYQFDAPKRFFDWPADNEVKYLLGGRTPKLNLPPVPNGIMPDAHRAVADVLFTLTMTQPQDAAWGEVNWQAFIDVITGAVLYIRPFMIGCFRTLFPTPTVRTSSAGASGRVFCIDPMTSHNTDPIATLGPAQPNSDKDAILNTYSSTVDLDVDTSQVPRILHGDFVSYYDVLDPDIIPDPSKPAPGVFTYGAYSEARQFTSVNAYYHCRSMFSMMKKLGFTDLKTDYFLGTTFPVSVDPLGTFGQVEALTFGNTNRNGVQKFAFGKLGPGSELGNATDIRLVFHEFCHALLWAGVHWQSFGFAHSAGDSLAAILCDPGSKLSGTVEAPERFVTFPWIGARNGAAVNWRYHGGKVDNRDVPGRWGWGGSKDIGGYSSEQILAMTLFTIYRALGGDALADPKRQRLAARYMAFLILQSIGAHADDSHNNSVTPGQYESKLKMADNGQPIFDDIEYGRLPGRLVQKVVRWGFERLGLQAKTPPHFVDVYIEDGRGGEYTYQASFPQTEIWNRTVPSGTAVQPGGDPNPLNNHQSPNLNVGFKNYIFVRVKSRTVSTTGVADARVKGYYRKLPNSGTLSWNTSWHEMQPMDGIGVPASLSPGNVSSPIGPFEWDPRSVAIAGDKVSILMSVSASGDESNLELTSSGTISAIPMPLWWLVPLDNNIAERTIQL